MVRKIPENERSPLVGKGQSQNDPRDLGKKGSFFQRVFSYFKKIWADSSISRLGEKLNRTFKTSKKVDNLKKAINDLMRPREQNRGSRGTSLDSRLSIPSPDKAHPTPSKGAHQTTPSKRSGVYFPPGDMFSVENLSQPQSSTQAKVGQTASTILYPAPYEPVKAEPVAERVDQLGDGEFEELWGTIDKEFEQALQSLENTPSPEESEINADFDQLTHAIDKEFEQVFASLENIPSPEESEINEDFDQLTRATEKIQHKFRQHVQVKAIKEAKARLITPLQRSQEAVRVAQSLNSKIAEEDRGYCVTVSPFFREPIVNPEKREGLIEAKEKFAKLVTHAKFNATLRGAFEDTLMTILSQPPEKRAYIILADHEDGEKSTNWVASQLLDLMGIHPPQAFVRKDHLEAYLKNHPEVATLVILDDGAYSGSQVARYISDSGQLSYIDQEGQMHLKEELKDKNFNICIPYMTKFAKERMTKSLENVGAMHYSFATHQKMLSYKELKDYGFVDDAKAFDPQLKPLLTISSIEDGGEKVDQLNKNLIELRKQIFNLTKKEIFDRVCSLIEEVENLQKPGDVALNPQLNLLLKTLTTVGFGLAGSRSVFFKSQEDENFYASYEANSQTGTWMAHKSADFFSSNQESMLKVASGQRAIEPYKEDEYDASKRRDSQITDLEIKNPKFSRQWIKAIDGTTLSSIHLIKGNRGVFLLSNNYISKPSDNEFQSILIIEDERIPFGGSDGAFQWEIKNGTKFSLEQNGIMSSFLYQDGNISRID